ncbi:helix-turn-helix transcriptional regulator [Larkinella knui]|uniref:Helix-turn-helix domain-containing protein n=1 Tax=Larkinella knui TaxID=2025310 RepID=A0A3P1CGI3_9BACT|nr:AraC family transcriptional regulator [Larkinella knui]RRB12298.1 helix-turn-helix domain-containing protein [Larkinella knui]
MKEKNLPVLHIDDFHQAAKHHPDVYVHLFKEHAEKHRFILTPHRHDFYLLVVFTQGEGTHTVDFVNYPIRPGSVFFMSPAQVHTWTYTEDADGYLIFFNADFYLVDFPARKLSDLPLFHSLATPPVAYLSGTNLADTETLFSRIHQEFTGNGYRREDVIRSYLNILLVKLSGFCLAHQPSPLSPYAQSQIRQLELLVEKWYLEHRTVREYAGMMALSEKQLYTVCQTALGKPLQKIIQDRLLLEAKRLLVHTELSVAQVADRLNFPDHSYFNRFFRKETGTTPEQFRRGYR